VILTGLPACMNVYLFVGAMKTINIYTQILGIRSQSCVDGVKLEILQDVKCWSEWGTWKERGCITQPLAGSYKTVIPGLGAGAI